MESKGHLVGIALALLFAIVLALTATLISMATVRTRLSDVAAGISAAATESGQDRTGAATASAGEPTEQTTESREPPQGLLYESLGNGTCAVVGLGACRDLLVAIPEVSPAGERVVRVAARAFYGCGQITAFEIPSTVREIGALAFADCASLVFISVSPDNPYFTDVGGVLFTADKRTLLVYPPMRAANPAVIPASVTGIAEMAFYNCRYLTSVRYEGSAEAWDRIAIGGRNYSLTAAAVEFADVSA